MKSGKIVKLRECYRCGVAYNVGFKRCYEPGCYSDKWHSQRSKPIYELEQMPKTVRKVQADPIRSRYNSTRLRAKNRQLEHDLTVEWIAETIAKPCVYCGDVGLSQLDRKDNERGYTMDNVVPACKRCNTVKNMYLTYDQMMTVSKALGWNHD